MKNNRLTNSEVIELRDTIQRIRDLASLQNCCYDDKIKKTVRPYLMWFEVEAMKIETILDSDK